MARIQRGCLLSPRVFISGFAIPNSAILLRLDFAIKKSNNPPILKQRSPNIVALGLAALFALAVLCSTFAAPGQALASTTGCPQTAGMAMVGCDNPAYLCDFDLAGNHLAHGAVASARSHDSVKNTLGLAIGTPAIDVSRELVPRDARARTSANFIASVGASVRLLNSVFNL